MSAHRTGFTLAELVVTLAILALAASAVVPALARVSSEDELGRSAERVAAMLRAARAQALTSASTVTVLLDPSTGRFSVVGRHSGSERDTLLADGMLALGREVHLSAGAARVRLAFEGSGLAIPDTLMLTAGGDRASVWADRWSGQVRIERTGAGP